MGLSGGWDRRKIDPLGSRHHELSIAMALPFAVWVWQADFPQALNMFVLYGPSHVTACR